jgi:hypothetical protein
VLRSAVQLFSWAVPVQQVKRSLLLCIFCAAGDALHHHLIACQLHHCIAGKTCSRSTLMIIRRGSLCNGFRCGSSAVCLCNLRHRGIIAVWLWTLKSC